MTTTPLGLLNYYKNLLIIQYKGKPRAVASIETTTTAILLAQTTVQVISFSRAPDSGEFFLAWQDTAVGPFAWDALAADIQAALRTISGLEAVTVTGSIASLALTVTFTGVPPIAELLELVTSSLMAGSKSVTVVIDETDETITVAAQNAFNLIGDNPAVGKQLDILGKYAGVARTAKGFTTQITLNDADFLRLIKMKIVQNNSDSSLAEIDQLIHQFFPGQVFVYDDKQMHLTYLVSSLAGSMDLIEVYLTEGLLPAPAGVSVNLIYLPVVDNLFGLRTYEADNPNVKPLNDYDDYHTEWHFLQYEDVITF